MGITARGAWEAVKRHFRETGHATSRTNDFTVVGVGDMSGDVFGNGMLLSKHIRLVAAFDHRHIFLDPNADAATELCRARAACSTCPAPAGTITTRRDRRPGGGVFARTLKEIPLTPEVQALIGTKDAKLCRLRP